jgi:glucan phosphoethanolaminetransferase (alkaline phosphatase superfamily)
LKLQYSDQNADGELRTRNLLFIAFYLFAIVMLSICFYALYISAEEYLNTHRLVIGEVLSNTEFPFHGSPKLVTYLMIASILSWFCITRLGRDKLRNITRPIKSILQLAILAIMVIALYESIYNFSLWNSFIIHNIIKGKYNLDSISVPYPHPNTPWNIIFAAKMTFAGFLISSHGFYIISKANKGYDKTTTLK